MIRVYRDRFRFAVLILAAATIAVAELASAQAPAKAPPPLDPKSLFVSPAAEPVPALKYRLLPSFADLNPGDAAPIYLRIRYATSDGLWNQLEKTWKPWLNVPLDRFPAVDARNFVDEWPRQLQQIEFGAHRQTCDWNYTVPEQRLDRVNVVLSDLQAMRQVGFLMAIKARVDIAEGNLDDAVHTLETNLAFARHIAEGPFLINSLVGAAIAAVSLDAVDDLIARPDAPNLYWALTALPRPLIDMRRELEIEQKLCEDLIPELKESELARPRTPAEWAALLTRMYEGIVKWKHFNMQQGKKDSGPPKLSQEEVCLFKSQALPAAREHLKRSRKLTNQLRAMSDDQVVALSLADGYREIWDDWFKASYLPAREVLARQDAAVERLKAAKKEPFTFFADEVPGIYAIFRNELRIDRHVAILRVIEALRLYAAAHKGALPESLGQITEVPVPDDPATGEPFIYRSADSAAILHSLRQDLPLGSSSYRITIRH